MASMPASSLVSEAGEAECLDSDMLFYSWAVAAHARCLQLTKSGLLILAGDGSDLILATKAADKIWPCRSRFMAAQTEPTLAAASCGRGGAVREPICRIRQAVVTHTEAGPWGTTLNRCQAGGRGELVPLPSCPLPFSIKCLCVCV